MTLAMAWPDGPLTFYRQRPNLPLGPDRQQRRHYGRRNEWELSPRSTAK